MLKINKKHDIMKIQTNNQKDLTLVGFTTRYGLKPVKDKEPIMGIPLPVLSGNWQWVAQLPPVVGFLFANKNYSFIKVELNNLIINL